METEAGAAAPGRNRFGYTPALDGLRGVAVLSVIAYHANVPFIMRGGWVGVDVFFVLSGFLITSLLVKEWDDRGSISLKHFYLRRVLRLFPGLFSFLAVYLVLTPFIFKGPFSKHFVDAMFVLFYVSNWTRAFGLDRPVALAHAWSLSMEEQFYLLWPPALRFMLGRRLTRNGLTGIVFLAALLSAAYRAHQFRHGVGPERLYNGLDSRADSLLIGCALALLLSNPRFQLTAAMKRWLGAASYPSMFCLFATALQVKWADPKLYLFLFLFNNLACAVIIWRAAASDGHSFQKVLERPLLVAVGRISYGLYLWHYPLIGLIQQRFDWPWPYVLLAGGTMTFCAAALSFHLIEKPFLRLKERVAA